MKKTVLIVLGAFAAVVMFFAVFGPTIRQSLYVPVTTVAITQYLHEQTMLRVVPSGAVHEDADGQSYVWVMAESDDIGEKYHYAKKSIVRITYKNDIYTGINGLLDDTTIIVGSDSELADKTRVTPK